MKEYAVSALGKADIRIITEKGQLVQDIIDIDPASTLEEIGEFVVAPEYTEINVCCEEWLGTIREELRDRIGEYFRGGRVP